MTTRCYLHGFVEGSALFHCFAQLYALELHIRKNASLAAYIVTVSRISNPTCVSWNKPRGLHSIVVVLTISNTVQYRCNCKHCKYYTNCYMHSFP